MNGDSPSGGFWMSEWIPREHGQVPFDYGRIQFRDAEVDLDEKGSVVAIRAKLVPDGPQVSIRLVTGFRSRRKI